MFDSSLTLVEAAAQGVGVALVPVSMFAHEIERGRIVQPFDITAFAGSYWLTRLRSRAETASMKAFHQWILVEIGKEESRRMHVPRSWKGTSV